MGRHEPPACGRPRIPFIVAGMVVVLGAATLVAVRLTAGSPGCDQPTVVRVAAAPGIASVVNQVGRKVAGPDGCYRFDVDDRDPGAIEESLGISDGSPRPDVWIPESTLRLRRANAAGATDVPASGSSVANSPVVLAVTEQAATGLGWPARRPDWSDVLRGPGITLGVPDPGRDPVGVAALIGVQDAVGGNGGAVYTAALRRLSQNTLPAVDDLYSRLPGAGGSKQPISGFPASENSLLRHNVRDSVAGGQGSLVAVYPPKPIPSLDYPFAVLAGAGKPQQDAADKLLRALLDPGGQAALADAGFRTPDGRSLRNRSQDEHVSVVTQTLAQLPSASGLDNLLNQWARVNQTSRARVLIDVSGSMNEIVPNSGGKSRMAVTLEAATKGLTLFKPASELSVWTFSTMLDGDRDYREVLPMALVGDLVTRGATDKIRAIRATTNGQTGLYDTVLAAYRQAREEWEAGRLNLVIVMTDGQNQDPQGISLDQLRAELAKLTDPGRPVPIIGIGIGPDINQAELTAITDPTGGRTFVAPDPTKITDVFYGALAALSNAGGS
ncbi:MAG TPA: substrate-binding and VWA domain-containing protein [Amycolatopsis sp.]|uniref:substrate-binding and VWA domain-containing protein n=1 Tax=Amycolatopsis sp. TaxID=37632 RepID=UPI002B482F36|nr:substrate-binding and VWA domain-containing protein [Amycolatopsis sp.]HKS49565.1 substrate-binding and VWA domain-containing protein [Amycolatopsis sp.]